MKKAFLSKLLMFTTFLFIPFSYSMKRGASNCYGPTKKIKLNDNYHFARFKPNNPFTGKNIKYSINVMWINEKLDKKQLFIHPAKSEEQLFCKDPDNGGFFCNIIEWAKLNPNSVVNVWFDSKVTTKQAVQNSKKLIESYSNPKMASIIFRDIRDVISDHNYLNIFCSKRPASLDSNTVCCINNLDTVFCEKIPVYFRTDLARCIITLHIIYSNETQCVVYADLDMKPLSKKELFDVQTLEYLKRFGIVMAREGERCFENGFHIVSNNNINLLRAFEKILVKLNILRALNAKSGTFIDKGYFDFCEGQGMDLDEYYLDSLVEVVYHTYIDMFKYFYFLEGYGDLNFFYPDEEDKLVEYDERIHDLKIFGFYNLPDNLVFITEDISLYTNKKYNIVRVPVKKVTLINQSDYH